MGRLGLKGCDIMYDVYRLQRKREHHRDMGSGVENSDIVRFKKQIRKTEHMEEDYVQFMMLLYNYDKFQPYTNEGRNESSSAVRYRPDEDDDEYEDEDADEDKYDDEVEDEDEDEDDPEYKKFLANVKPNGTSYVLRVDRKDGYPMFIEYEKEDVSDEEFEHLGRRKQQDAGDDRDLGNVSSKDKIESHPLSRIVLDESDEEYEYLGRRKQQDTGDERNLGNVSSKDKVESQPLSRIFLDDDDDDNDISSEDSDVSFDPDDDNDISSEDSDVSFDPVPQKKKGTSSEKLNMGEDGAVKRRQKGEAKNKSKKLRKTEKGRKPANITAKEEAADVDEDYSLLLEKFISGNWCLNASFIKKYGIKRKPLSKYVKKKKKKRKSVKKNDGSKRQAKGKKRKRSSKEQTTRKGRKLADVTVEEEVAGRNSANVTVKEEVAAVEEASFKCGHIIEYMAAEEAPQILDNENGGKEGSSNLMEASSAKHIESVEECCPLKVVHSDFWCNVKALLERPYDQREYEGLWKVVKSRKHTVRNMDLRNGAKSFSTRLMGKSYLDHYRDLRKKLKEVDDDNRKKLNILRGFFFWLQNLTQEGAFKPWTDPEWLSLVDTSS